MPHSPNPPNRYQVGPDITKLIVTRRNGERHVFTIDTADYEEVRRYRWRILGDAYGFQYAVTGQPEHGEYLLLHRLVNQTPADLECRFRDHDTHNCRRSNLVAGTHFETMIAGRKVSRSARQKSGEPNVSIGPTGRWVVRFKRNRRVITVGTFDTIPEAVTARDAYLEAEKEREAA